MLLPCHAEKDCSAPCCSLITPWERSSLRRLLAVYPDLLKDKSVRIICLADKRLDMYFLIPQDDIFARGETIAFDEFSRLVKLKKQAGMDSCIFLEAGRCSIYDLRPKICEEFANIDPCPWAV